MRQRAAWHVLHGRLPSAIWRATRRLELESHLFSPQFRAGVGLEASDRICGLGVVVTPLQGAGHCIDADEITM